MSDSDFTSVTEMKAQIAEITQQVDTLETKSLTLRQEVRTINEMLFLIQMATGNKSIDAGIQKCQQLLMILMRVRMTLLVVQELEAGTLGPIGWLYAGANALMVVSSSANLMSSIGE